MNSVKSKGENQLERKGILWINTPMQRTMEPPNYWVGIRKTVFHGSILRFYVS